MQLSYFVPSILHSDWLICRGQGPPRPNETDLCGGVVSTSVSLGQRQAGKQETKLEWACLRREPAVHKDASLKPDPIVGSGTVPGELAVRRLFPAVD